MLYLLLISKKGWYIVHSVHSNRNIAEEWAKCKEWEGEDTYVADISMDNVDILIRLYENITSSKTKTL